MNTNEVFTYAKLMKLLKANTHLLPEGELVTINELINQIVCNKQQVKAYCNDRRIYAVERLVEPIGIEYFQMH